MHTDHNDSSRRDLLGNSEGRVIATQSGHSYVKQDHIGFVEHSEIDRFIAVCRFGHHFEFPAPLEHRTKAASDERVVIGNYDSYA